ncbi:PhoH family protein [Aestuariivirga sp.]|uniref:PhoH family protein n=1 Tax=Aestuariivirga sp. TaxID=2650926 RepID=UPI0025C33281|nr:PhoH family protein [Aestuariivirga sp.]MCA3554356.1 PhoH family protein [Aestuariivirga sp.]
MGSHASGSRQEESDILTLSFDDNRLLLLLCGEHDENLAVLEHRLSVDITPRGNRLAVRGSDSGRNAARDVLMALYNRARRGLDITKGEVDGAIRMREAQETNVPGGAIRTRRKLVTPRTPTQGAYIEAIRKHELVFGIGPAGTGKTYLAVACAAEALMNGEVDRIVLSRPAVEAGERLGFLPGDMKEKVDPYLRPLYDALYDMMPASLVAKGIAENQIEIAPLAFMRGRTLSAAFIILDEAQNTTPQQMKMFLTRLGEGSRMVVTGDPTQVDLPSGISSGLPDAVGVLKGVAGVASVCFSNSDIVRHALVGRIVAAYDKKAPKPRK